MIEIYIKDKKIFDRFKGVAAYSSELTHVCSFNDNLAEDLARAGLQVPGFNDENGAFVPKEREPQIITMTGEVMTIKNPEPETLSFLGNRMTDDHDISVFYMDRVSMLIQAGIILPDKKFKEFYSKISLDLQETTLDTLLYGNRSLRRQNATKIIQEKTGKEGQIMIGDGPFNEDDYRTKPISYYNAKVQFTSSLTYDSKNRRYTIEAISEKKQRFTIRTYTRFTELENLIMYKGGVANIAFTKYTTVGTTFVVDSPDILPEGFKMKLATMYTPRTRMLKVDHWRALFFELKYRNMLNDKGDIDFRRLRGLSSKVEAGVFE